MAPTQKNVRTRVYKFNEKNGGPAVRLVRGPNKTAALAQAARELYKVSVATQDDLEELLPKGVKIERYDPVEDEPAAGADAETQT